MRVKYNVGIMCADRNATEIKMNNYFNEWHYNSDLIMNNLKLYWQNLSIRILGQ